MNPNKCSIIMYVIIYAGLLIACVLAFTLGEELLWLSITIGAVTSVAGIIFGIVTIRCPHCRSSLPIRIFGLDYCPYCGEKIEQTK